MKIDKRFAYRVISSTYPKIKVGAIHLYEQGKGPTHVEHIYNTKTFKHVGAFTMEKVGMCYVVGGKVQFEKPPLKSGKLTRDTIAGLSKKKK